MLKSSPIFKKYGAHLEKKNMFKKVRIIYFQSFSVLNTLKFFSFVSSFEHINFAINGKYSQKHYDNSNYCVSFMIFQTYKNAILRSVHAFTWVAPLTMILPM